MKYTLVLLQLASILLCLAGLLFLGAALFGWRDTAPLWASSAAFLLSGLFTIVRSLLIKNDGEAEK